MIRRYGKHNISTDGGNWYPQACRFLNIEHHNHSSIEKIFIERTIQYIKDRTECFDDYFPCTRINCKLEHIVKWLILFVDMHNRDLIVQNEESLNEQGLLYILKIYKFVDDAISITVSVESGCFQ